VLLNKKLRHLSYWYLKMKDAEKKLNKGGTNEIY